MCEYIAKLVPINNMRIIEIGSWVGTSAVEFAKYFRKVICVDPFIPIKGVTDTKTLIGTKSLTGEK